MDKKQLFAALQHEIYIQGINFDQPRKESIMSVTKLISWLVAARPVKTAETISYDSIFLGATDLPVAASGNFLPGLRVVGNDVDAYFKDVFAGPVF